MATWLKADGTQEEVAPRNGRDFKLDELQAFVGGWVEVCHPRSRGNTRKILVVNEEGKLMGLPFNARATEIYSEPWDIIVGDALLCKSTEVK